MPNMAWVDRLRCTGVLKAIAAAQEYAHVAAQSGLSCWYVYHSSVCTNCVLPVPGGPMMSICGGSPGSGLLRRSKYRAMRINGTA